MRWREHWRSLALGLPTVLGLKQRGFFIPCRFATVAGSSVLPDPFYPVIDTWMTEARPRFDALFDAIDGYAADLAAIDAASAPAPAPRWWQDWFPRLDAAAAYALIRSRAPRHVVEVGSGHSTRWFARAVADGGLATRIVAIDPRPRAAINGLGVQVLRCPLQQAGTAPFARLQAGDMLAIDGSHVLMPGTDVDWLLNRVLPALPAGALVHLHDIFLPDPYPAEWSWRGYNEQQGVAALLQGGGWRILWSSRWASTRLTDRLAASVLAAVPLPSDAYESSLWLEKCPFTGSKGIFDQL
ncbi:MAG: class I SAM-dependent methyltransferase [Rhodospirillales bacterium]|nr:class I SAM-dependent methyltransferase [Rhodospirillales bacterium]